MRTSKCNAVASQGSDPLNDDNLVGGKKDAVLLCDWRIIFSFRSSSSLSGFGHLRPARHEEWDERAAGISMLCMSFLYVSETVIHNVRPDKFHISC